MRRRYWIGVALTVVGALAVLFGTRLRSASFSLEHVVEYTDEPEPAAADVDE